MIVQKNIIAFPETGSPELCSQSQAVQPYSFSPLEFYNIPLCQNCIRGHTISKRISYVRMPVAVDAKCNRKYA